MTVTGPGVLVYAAEREIESSENVVDEPLSRWKLKNPHGVILAVFHGPFLRPAYCIMSAPGPNWNDACRRNPRYWVLGICPRQSF